MAKWGKGDPRWLVEERPDGTNVNNWHWTEKNANHWSRVKFEELFVGLKVKEDHGQCEITEILKCEGDAAVNNRKGKLIFFYDWNIDMKWKGTLNYGPVIEGKLAVCHWTEEIDVNDVDIVIYFDDDRDDATTLGGLMQSDGTPIIREQLSAYVIALKEIFARDLILPTQYYSDPVMATSSNVTQYWQQNEQDATSTLPYHTSETADLYTSESFKCTAEEIYRAMTVKDMVEAFTQSDCVLEATEGGKFELFDGNVQGYFVKLEPFRRIVLKWRSKSWPKEHFSDVVLEIDQKTDCTDITISQTGIPKEDVENTREGFKRYYWDSIKRVFGFGAFLF